MYCVVSLRREIILKLLKTSYYLYCIYAMDYKLKLKLSVLVGTLSDIQSFSHTLIVNFLWSLDYIRKLAFGSPWVPVLCEANIRQVPIHTLVEWNLRDSFLVPWEIHVRPVDSNQDILGLIVMETFHHAWGWNQSLLAN